jgi:hypothetical protein
VISLGGGLDFFLNSVFNYPTLAEVYKIAAHNAANRLRHVRGPRHKVDAEMPETPQKPLVSAEVPDRDDPRPHEEPPPAASRTTERSNDD